MTDDDTNRMQGGKVRLSLQVSLVQGMIVLNGLLLTIAACFIVWGFTQEIVHDSYQSLATETQQTVMRNIAEMEHEMEEAATLLKSLSVDQIDKSGFSKFDRVFLAHPSQMSTSWETENVKMASSHMGGGGREILSSSAEPEFLNAVHKALHDYDASQRVLVLNHVVGINPMQNDSLPGATAMPLIFATSIQKSDGIRTTLIGVARADSLFDSAWLGKRLEIETLALRGSDGQSIFDLKRGKKDKRFFHSKPHGLSGLNVPIMGQNSMSLAMTVTKNRRMEIITAMPLAVLFFGHVVDVDRSVLRA